MFRLFAIAAVVVAFGVTLYYSGDALEAWESPQPSAKAAPTKHSKSKTKRSRHRAAPKRTRQPVQKTQATWLTQLNTLCRRSEAEAAAIPLPITPAGTGYYVRQVVQVARRFNRRAEALVRSGSNPDSARRLGQLFDEEEALIRGIASAADRGQVERLRQIAPALQRVAKSENRILAALGAHDCTAPENPFRL